MSRVRGGKTLLLRWVLAGGWLLTPPALAAGEERPIQQVTCSLPAMLEDLRAALKTGTPELQRYMKELIKESALGLPLDELVSAIERERDPAVLEALAAGLATRSSNASDPKLLRPLLLRAMKDGDAQARAAAVRGLRGIHSVEVLEKNADVANYEQLIRDASPEVRQAVVENITHESVNVFAGQNAAVAEAAVSLAMVTEDPALAAKLLREVSMEHVGSEGVRKLTGQLRSESSNVRAAAASALGGVPASEAPGARNSLHELYRNERDPGVRKAILQSIAQLGFASAVPTLEGLRSVDSTLAPEIDAWLKALRIPVQEWSLIRREKERLRK
ncbi:MAG TPA: HEAT repeat domain-containing protein [Archangium sp.]|nr:HEAT repeat domain-containing protein [Archangium sp.]